MGLKISVMQKECLPVCLKRGYIRGCLSLSHSTLAALRSLMQSSQSTIQSVGGPESFRSTEE